MPDQVLQQLRSPQRGIADAFQHFGNPAGLNAVCYLERSKLRILNHG